MSNVVKEVGSVHLEGVLKLHKQEESPNSSSDHGHVFAMELSGSTHLYAMDSDGNETKISPHNQEGEWEYYCRNKKTGKHIKINMEKMIRKLEEITGETFIEIIE